jgi:hypothetical protein
VAYVAARDLLLRTTEALIGSEALVLDLQRRLDAQIQENERLLRWQHERSTAGGDLDGEVADPVGYTAAVGQAD